MLYHQQKMLGFREGIKERDNAIDRAKGVASIAMVLVTVVLFHLSHGQVLSQFELALSYLYYVIPTVFVFLFSLVIARDRSGFTIMKRFGYMFVAAFLMDALYRYLALSPVLYSIYINFAIAALVVPMLMRATTLVLLVMVGVVILLVCLHSLGAPFLGEPSQWMFADRGLAWQGTPVLQYPLVLFLLPVLCGVLYARTGDKLVLGVSLFLGGVFAYLFSTRGVELGWVLLPAFGLHEVILTCAAMGLVLWFLSPRLPLAIDMIILPLGRNVFLTFLLMNVLLVAAFFAAGWSFSYGFIGYQPIGWLKVDELPFPIDYRYYLAVSFVILAIALLLSRSLENIKWRRGISRAVNEMPVPKI